MSEHDDEIRFSVFNNAKDTKPVALRMTWEKFVAGLGPHRFNVADKNACQMFSPAEFREGAENRRRENIIAVWFGVLDLDGISPRQLLEVCQKLEGLDAVLYTTWSHPAAAAKDSWKIRVCVRFTRPVAVHEWPPVWRGLNRFFGELNDPACKDPGRCYFVPCAPPGTPPEVCQIIPFQGEAIDPSDLVSLEGAAPPPGVAEIPRERLQQIAQRWKRAKNPYRVKMGDTLLAVSKGEAFAEPGHRDTTLFQLCRDLAKELPEADAESVSLLFAPSLHLMGVDAPTTESVQAKFEAARVDAIREAEQAELSILEEQQVRIQQCFAHSDPNRTYSYTAPELNDMRGKLGCTESQLTKLWIIQVASQFFFLGPGAVYLGPYCKDDVDTAALRELAPATTANVNLWIETEKGRIQKGLRALMAEYGSAAKGYVLDLSAQEASYDAASRIFTVAPCPLRKLEPAYDSEVAKWLEILAGDSHADVLNWLAHATDLSIPCTALMMTGAPDTGKSLLANGVSRLWTLNGPTKASTALSDFNASITTCPLVFADEKLPTDHRGQGKTSELREFIADRQRPFKQKFLREGTMIGSIRFIGAANNDNFMAINEHLTTNDILAVAQRFYHLRVQETAADFLRTVDVRRFIEGDAIARHVLWLRDNFPKKAEGRFILKPKDPEFYSGLSTRSGYRSHFLQWAIGYLKEPSRIDARANLNVRIKNGGLWVRTEQVLECWDVYVLHTPPPSARLLALVIKELSDERTRLDHPTLNRPTYYRVDPTHLHAWAAETDYMTREEIDRVLSKDTEERMRSVPLAPR